MEKVIIAFTGSSTSSQTAVPGVADSILVYSTGTEIVVKLLVTNDAYTLSIPATLERFLGIGDSQKVNGGVYPPSVCGTSERGVTNRATLSCARYFPTL
jgi:hypothetical protein